MDSGSLGFLVLFVLFVLLGVQRPTGVSCGLHDLVEQVQGLLVRVQVLEAVDEVKHFTTEPFGVVGRQRSAGAVFMLDSKSTIVTIKVHPGDFIRGEHDAGVSSSFQGCKSR